MGKDFRVSLEVAFVSTPIKNLKDHGQVMVDHAVLYPHEVFAATWEKGRPIFDYVFLGSDGVAGLKDFWQKQQGEEWVHEHPGFCREGATFDQSIPYGLHADKGQQKKLCISWGSVLGMAPTIYSKILFSIVPDDILLPGITDERLYAVFTWSTYFLMKGVWPSVDHDGEPWPAGTRRAINAGRPLAGSVAWTQGDPLVTPDGR